jgi:hypothetical protein
MTATTNWSRRTPLATIALCLVIAGSATAQDADDAFRRGLGLLEDKQWQAAASAMRDAIKARGQESTNRVRSGLGGVFGAGGTEYLPYYFLGQALNGAGDCAGAVTAWATSESQGAIQKSRPEFLKLLRSGYSECEKKGVLPPARLDPALARLFQQIDSTNKLLTTITSTADANVDVWRAESGIREQYDRGRADFEIARARYDAARTTRAQRDIDTAIAAIERARPVLEKVEAGFRAAIDSRLSAQALAREVGEAITLAESLHTAVESRKVPFTPAMTAALQDGREAIGRARERLNDGQRSANPQTLSAARTLAVDAQSRFRQLLEEVVRIEKDILQRQLGEALTRTLESFSLLDSAVTALERFSAERPAVLPADKEAERKAVQEQVNRARRRLEQARKSDNLAAINDAARLADAARERLNVLIASFGPLTLRDRGVHAMLEQGARHYFSGEYSEAVAALAAGETDDAGVALRLHFHLLRAAALYQLFLQSHGKQPALETQAREEVQHSKAIDSMFQPDPRAFSPRFISFYATVNPPAPAATPLAAVEPAAPRP